jgi:nucleoside-diphosphate-sugar epimerase
VEVKDLLLLTGAGGFIGSHCLGLATEHYEILATTSRSAPPARKGVQWVRLDLLDEPAVRRLIASERPSHLLHAAWRHVHGDVMSSPENLRWMRASLALVEAFREHGGTRAAVLGSCAEDDWSSGVWRPTSAPHRPHSLYGATKLAMRMALEAYAARTRLSLVWPRPFSLYGPGENESRLVAYVVNALLDGKPAETTDGRQIRDYLHVRDAASGIVAALQSDVVGPLDICSGEAITVREMVREIARQIGREDLLRLGARLAAADEVKVVLGDPRPAREKLGWRPMFGLEDGLADTIAAARAAQAPMVTVE